LVLVGGLKLIFLLLEQQVERRQRPVAARDVLLHINLLSICQSRVRIDLLFENTQLVSDANDLMKEHFERNLLGL